MEKIWRAGEIEMFASVLSGSRASRLEVTRDLDIQPGSGLQLEISIHMFSA